MKRPIPSPLNFTLTVFVFLTGNGLIWLGNGSGMGLKIIYAFVFSHLFLTNYALMHEGAHRMLHANPKLNDGLGLITGLLFPASFTMMRLTHLVHHRCNRTDHEMFDCYYKGDRIWLKYLQWYSILLGFFWLIIPIGSVVIAVHHRLLLTKPFKKSRSSSVLFDDFSSADLWRVRVEVIIAVCYFYFLFAVLAIDWETLLLFYVCSAFNWSTRQYVTHAWSKRDVILGAHNLTASRVMRWILLNGHWDLVHHVHPNTSWLYLPELGRQSSPPRSFFKQYISQWKGPRLTTEVAPQAIIILPE